MRTLTCAVLLLTAVAIPLGAQTRIVGKQTCAKSDPTYSMEVGDRSGHVLTLEKSACTWETPITIEGIRTKDAVDVSTAEVRGMRMTERGYNTTTMENGDKFTVRYSGHGAATKDGGMNFAGKWTFVRGTGKLKGIKGGGTYKGTGNADGSGTVEVEGEYTMSRSAMARPKTSRKPAK